MDAPEEPFAAPSKPSAEASTALQCPGCRASLAGKDFGSPTSRLPRTLSCGHTLCAECSDIVEQLLLPTCTVCSTNVAKGTHASPTLGRLGGGVALDGPPVAADARAECLRHPPHSLAHFCLQCGTPMCDDCLLEHNAQDGAGAEHVVEDLATNPAALVVAWHDFEAAAGAAKATAAADCEAVRHMKADLLAQREACKARFAREAERSKAAIDRIVQLQLAELDAQHDKTRKLLDAFDDELQVSAAQLEAYLAAGATASSSRAQAEVLRDVRAARPLLHRGSVKNKLPGFDAVVPEVVESGCTVGFCVSPLHDVLRGVRQPAAGEDTAQYIEAMVQLGDSAFALPTVVYQVICAVRAALQRDALDRVAAADTALIPFIVRVLRWPRHMNNRMIVLGVLHTLRWLLASKVITDKNERGARALLQACGFSRIVDVARAHAQHSAVQIAFAVVVRLYARWDVTIADVAGNEHAGDALFAAIDENRNSLAVTVACLEALRNAVIRVQGAAFAVKEPWVKCLIWCMTALLEDAVVQHHVLALLWGIAVHPENQRNVVLWGAMPFLLAVLTRWMGDSKVVGVALGCLRALAMVPDNRIDIHAEDGLKYIMEAMQKHVGSAYCQEQGCVTLWNMTATHSLRQPAVAKGGVQRVVDAMRHHPDNVDVQMQGTGALWYMSLHNPDGGAEVARLGGPALVRAAKSAFPTHSKMNDTGNQFLAHLQATENPLIVHANHGSC